MGVGITVLATGGAEVLAVAGEAAAELEELQFVLGEGPTPDTSLNAKPVLVPDLSSAGGRWVQFASAAERRGVRGVYAFPLQLGGVRLGVCTFYLRAVETPDSHRLAALLNHVDAARELLLGSLDGDGRSRSPVEALPLRTEVYQAQGMLMVALSISLADALVRLRAMAYAEDIDVNVLATQLVSGRRPMPGTAGGAE
jgi:hypothetical protein